jgi:pimeloyl-ACP methyl ester carboxylesterase
MHRGYTLSRVKGFRYGGGGLAAFILVAGCAAPFGVRHASPDAVHRSLTANVLSTGDLSNFSQIALHRRNLTEAFHDDPGGTLRILHGELREGRLSNDDLFALAELSFYHADRGGGKQHFLAAAVYAYAYLFPDDSQTAPSPFDPRQRVAMDLYNRALTEAFKSEDGKHVEIAAGKHLLPFGIIEIEFDDRQLHWGERRLANFSPAAELEVTGFENRYRQPGIGAPLAAATLPHDPNEPLRDFVGQKVRVPVTALVRLPRPRQQITTSSVSATLEIYPATEALDAKINGQSVPLEQEPTAALALSLSESRPWATELGVFLGQILRLETAPRLGAREPHRHGRIPVVLVHGTASNFSVWANLVNDLDSDPVIREKFEIWIFTYDSGQPILYSGMQLRRALTEAVRAFQAEQPDPCLNAMVVIGHSQGGLLTKLTAIDSGDLFWRNASDVPIEQLGLSAETQTLLREAMFVEPLPFVKRVVFIATPHRGSYLAGPTIVRRLAQRLITMPAGLLRGTAELVASDPVRRRTRLEQIPTSIDNMSPGHPFIVTIAKIPVAPDVVANSIIGVPGDGPIESGNDGVVEYSSAHIDGVESELVVPYGHSMQAKPEVVAEVQRILHRHLELNPCAGSGAHAGLAAVE